MAYNPNFAAGQTTASASMPVTIASDQSALPMRVADVTGSASLTATATAGAACASNGAAGTFVVQLTGTFVGTVQIQVTVDGSTWVNVTGSNSIVNMATGGYMASGNLTAAGVYEMSVAGVNSVRVITTAYTSGTIVVSTRLTQGAPSMVSVVGTSLVSGSVTVTPASGTSYNLVTAATTNAAVVKASAGSLYELAVSNLTASAIYVKFYNKASAPTVGTDVPVLTIPVVANATLMQPFGALGKRFGTGIAIAVTGAAVATDTTAVAVGAQINATYA